MNNVKVSIIVPVYNLEKYISKTLDSLLNIKCSLDYEIIVINDGSTDKSEEIISRYQKNNECIKLFTIENKGVSNARNFGISCANGKYITFVDGDDTVENGDEEYTLEELVDKYFEYSKEKSKYEKKRMEYESQMKKIQAFIETKTNVSEGLIILNDNAEKNCQIKYSKRCRTSINKESLEKMQIVDKELYDELVGKGYLTTSECNIFKPKYVRKDNN